jgi:hypothetical protein
MKTTFTILILLSNIALWAQQTQPDSADFYISMLNQNSATVGTSYAPKMNFDASAQRLLTLKSAAVERKLYSHLGEKEKTVAIHAILTRRLQVNAAVSQQYTYRGDTISAVAITYNHLTWHYDLTNGQTIINDVEIKHAQSYWRRKIKE